jgi:RNA polymerase sigma-70 factor (ECF subfamily)
MAAIENIDSIYWTRLKDGDSTALGYLYERHVDKLFLSAMRLTNNRELAKDALQEVFVHLWHYRKTLSAVNHSQSYLMKILRNTLIRKLKKEKPTAQLLMADAVASEESNREDMLIRLDTDKERRIRLDHAISSLSSRQILILKLHFYEGLSYEQIAEKLSMNYQSVNNLAFRTILRLRNHFSAALIFVLVI